MARERTSADHDDGMSSPIGGKNMINLKAMSGSEDGLDRERSASVQVIFKYKNMWDTTKADVIKPQLPHISKTTFPLL